ncbi:MAG: TlpA family protein disulfide reductase [Kangiellaceae bacterium]|nr:TlpA family protein disulfide reductase [Kangiellaceae bacterium]
MKTIPYFRILLLFLLCVTSQSCNNSPDFYLLDRTAKSLDDYRGKWVIINFWAEWCAPCQKEVPELNQLFEQRSQMNMEIIGISYDPLPTGEIVSIVNRWNIRYPVMVSEPSPILPFSLPISLPSNYIIDPKGKLVAKMQGEQTYDSVTKLLNSLKKKTNQSQ